MSWLSKLLGLDKHPAELAEINAVGGAIVKGVEASSPKAGILINAAEAIGAAPTNPITVVTSAGTVVSAFDPAFISQVEGVTNKLIRTFASKFPQIPQAEVDAFIATVDAGEEGVLEAIGFKAPSTAAS